MAKCWIVSNRVLQAEIPMDVRVQPPSNERDFERLSAMSGEAFDRAWLDAMVDDHEDAIEEIEEKAGDAREHADVKSWAEKTLPTVRDHLERAKALRDRVANNM